ncbi:hypothetical protein A3D80_03465 [Candidatus Roizmanbacteria bacterium RIFCSPHIGHO2_02_FULL_40_13b]|uniref:Type I restriction modification DNA specificity domain-containing protein n=1 Tax=Candidatus Roizmanbacteria bacterium RIFCSPHIGHO2_01_FULL_39_24 TaxID=1802032 RepID=A0A1F7GJG2_9BACT|nr:MAG: hypothetical protein A2799_04350 [Candidatus Roizmanbacteria bacterium RIFCSPHIGHO2_01_FULL_39_24]OGK27025.1 MAG: hypothetical protein A3D80_03465 [Candidatus Roizmanbacteria bacterium RIFCSPHIGHO2_02_FULL_40_13b]OGK48820.1 MAG: hypothetical protein A3A56_01260 [Candidatus Roizmanbacteria bacterium RIFCSPLOWO2_01_FULL_40_32]OGK57293.1 MAG: hypothetical protein A3H83_00130 [Candidatus Roizmanbacteria bacterium RIFCSPLOWO2_02_FULL_39_8]
MKNNWQTKKLSETCDFYNGLWKGKEPPYINIGVIRNTNITKDGRLDDSDVAYLDVEKKQFANRKLMYGDIVLEKSGGGPKQPVGRVIIFNKKDGEFSFSNFTSVIRIKDQSELDFNFLHKFLFYSYISGITERMQSHSTGIRNLNMQAYKDIEAPLPSFSEQTRIVKKLDEVFGKVAKAKENTEKNLQNSKELFESYLQSVFANPGKDWEENTLDEVCKYDKTPYKKTNLPYVGLEDIESNTGKFLGSLNPLKVKSNTFHFSGEHVLYGRLRPYLNKVLLPNFEGHCSTEIFPIKPNKNLYRNFLFYWLISKETVKQINATWTGARMPRANMNLVLDFVIPMPNISEQKSIVIKLDALSAETKKLEVIYKQKLADLEEMKKSVLRKAFAGEL